MKQKTTLPKSETDLEKLETMTDEEIDTSDIAPISPEMFAKGVVRRGLKPVTHKKQMTIRLDSDVLEWFQQQGRGYQTQINELLRAYMNEVKEHHTSEAV